MNKVLIIAVSLAGAALAQTPVVNPGGIVNVASYTYAGLPGGDIAQGSMVAIFGSNLGPATGQQATTYPLPTSLGGTTVRITSGATTTNAILSYVAAGQISAIVPSATPVGSATVTVTYNGQSSAPVGFKIVANSFGVFAANAGGSGPGIITNAASAVYGASSAANPGDAAVLWGTGLGAVSGNEAAGALPGDQSSIPVEVTVGSQKATLTYRGRSGCCAGVDQITFTVPNVTGCRVPVVLKINNAVSNYTTMPIAAAGSRVCSDPGGPSATDQQRFSQNGAAIGVVALVRANTSITVPILGSITTSADVGSAAFWKYSASQLTTAQNPFNTATVGACTVSYYKGASAPASTDPILPTSLDAGSAITVSGAGGSKQLAKVTAGGVSTYSGLLGSAQGGASGFLDAGTVTISGPGGNDVGAFTTTLKVPAALVWTNQASITNVNRAQGQTVTWTGGDPAGSVLIAGGSPTGSAVDSVGGTFTCTAKVSDGQFTIPATVLLSLPVSGTVSGVPLGSMVLGTATAPQTFNASGLDMGVAVATVDNVKTLNYQ